MILSRHAEKLNIYRAIIDILIITISWILAFIIRFNFEIIALTKGPDTLFNYLRLLPLLLLCYFFIFLTSGMYKKSLVKKRIWDENFQLAKNHTISFFIFVSHAFIK